MHDTSSVSSGDSAVPGLIARNTLPSGVVVLRLGASTERALSFTVERMDSLRKALEQLAKEKPAGLIITGGSTEMFSVGADIGLIQSVADATKGEQLAREGQKLFDLIEELPFVTVAAISGPCVGGACELALACKIRLISDHKSSLIGLPETKLGILPGFGGTQRLPRLVGLPKALDIILAGKTLRPRQAYGCGLVDEIVSAHKLLERAEAFALGRDARGSVNLRRRPIRLVDKVLTRTGFGRRFVQRKVFARLQRETKGFYPAPAAALEACIYGLDRGQHEGLLHEARALGQLIVTRECKGLVRIFLLSEASKALGKAGRKHVEQVQATVVGAGSMGAGIASALAKSECSVVLKDTSDQALQRAKQHVQAYLAKQKYLSDAERSFIFNRIEFSSHDSSNISNSMIAIEAVYEEMGLKKKILGDLYKQLPADAIVATNTSSLSVSELATAVESPARVVGMHFFNPVEKMPLVEIVRGKQTNDRALALVSALTVKMGKFPIIVTDVAGFLVNRILVPYLNEAAHLLQEGYTVAAIDKAALGFGMPMGPLRLLDEVGLDVAAHVSEIMTAAYGERMSAPGFSKLLVAAGRKGRKNSAGFYDYQDKNEQPHAGLRAILGITQPERHPSELEPLAERLLLPMLNEAVRCLDEGVAGEPGPEAAGQVDLGSVMGFGFPPFRGGILNYACTLGTQRVAERLKLLEKTYGARFAPASGVERRLGRNKSFHEAL